MHGLLLAPAVSPIPRSTLILHACHRGPMSFTCQLPLLRDPVVSPKASAVSGSLPPQPATCQAAFLRSHVTSHNTATKLPPYASHHSCCCHPVPHTACLLAVHSTGLPRPPLPLLTPYSCLSHYYWPHPKLRPSATKPQASALTRDFSDKWFLLA